MANNIQFSIAIHILAGLACGCDKEGLTSAKLAVSVNTSPSFVRRTLSKLSKAGLVETATGKAGACWLAKDAKCISLLDIYRAVDAPKALPFTIMPNRKPARLVATSKLHWKTRWQKPRRRWK
jgi:DNA-binding IscR family transcriptional regulator